MISLLHEYWWVLFGAGIVMTIVCFANAATYDKKSKNDILFLLYSGTDPKNLPGKKAFNNALNSGIIAVLLLIASVVAIALPI